jgi:hypothetical protein
LDWSIETGDLAASDIEAQEPGIQPVFGQAAGTGIFLGELGFLGGEEHGEEDCGEEAR